MHVDKPLCDTTSHACRGCMSDAECDAGACDLEAATCVAPERIRYTAPAATLPAANIVAHSAGFLDLCSGRSLTLDHVNVTGSVGLLGNATDPFGVTGNGHVDLAYGTVDVTSSTFASSP